MEGKSHLGARALKGNSPTELLGVRYLTLNAAPKTVEVQDLRMNGSKVAIQLVNSEARVATVLFDATSGRITDAWMTRGSKTRPLSWLIRSGADEAR